MIRASFCCLLIAAALLCSAAPAAAQQTPPTSEAPPPAPPPPAAPSAQPPPVVPPPGAVVATPPVVMYRTPADLEYELEEAKEASRRTRNALIGTSAAFGLGVILAGIGASQCQWIDRIDESDEWLCNNAGDVLVPLGGAIAGTAVIGMITSGAMLGVRNRNKREIERDLRRRYYGSRFFWDPASSRFRF